MSRNNDDIIQAIASLEAEVKNVSKRQDTIAEEVKILIDRQTQMKGAYKLFIAVISIFATVVGAYYTLTKSN